jgi:hypothetical protein
MNSITLVRFASGRTVTSHYLWQYDYGQTLKIEGLDLPTAYEVHFSNQENIGTAKTSIGNADGVTIPDEYLLSGKTVYAWIFLHDTETDGETEYKIIIPVRKRAKPTDIEPTPVQQDTITQAIAALNTAVEQTTQDVESTEQNALKSQSYAVGGTGTREGEDFDNAKHYAELAEQHANIAGYVFFDVNDEDGELYATVADSLDEDLGFEVNEETGELEVIIK